MILSVFWDICIYISRLGASVGQSGSRPLSGIDLCVSMPIQIEFKKMIKPEIRSAAKTKQDHRERMDNSSQGGNVNMESAPLIAYGTQAILMHSMQTCNQNQKRACWKLCPLNTSSAAFVASTSCAAVLWVLLAVHWQTKAARAVQGKSIAYILHTKKLHRNVHKSKPQP